MSYSTQGFGLNSPTGCVLPSAFAPNHAYSCSDASLSPQCMNVVVPARQAYSHCASLGRSYLIPCLFDSPVWHATARDLFDVCIGSLAEDGFLQPGDVSRLLLLRDPAAYPVYRRDYAGHLQRVLHYIEGRAGLSTLGRSGQFMYMDVDKCFELAFECADGIAREMGAEAD